MDAVLYPRWNVGNATVAPGLLAAERLAHESPILPEEEDQLVYCPECWELAGSAVLLQHKVWCSGRTPAEPASF